MCIYLFTFYIISINYVTFIGQILIFWSSWSKTRLSFQILYHNVNKKYVKGWCRAAVSEHVRQDSMLYNSCYDWIAFHFNLSIFFFLIYEMGPQIWKILTYVFFTISFISTWKIVLDLFVLNSTFFQNQT